MNLFNSRPKQQQHSIACALVNAVLNTNRVINTLKKSSFGTQKIELLSPELPSNKGTMRAPTLELPSNISTMGASTPELPSNISTMGAPTPELPSNISTMGAADNLTRITQ